MSARILAFRPRLPVAAQVTLVVPAALLVLLARLALASGSGAGRR